MYNQSCLPLKRPENQPVSPYCPAVRGGRLMTCPPGHVGTAQLTSFSNFSDKTNPVSAKIRIGRLGFLILIAQNTAIGALY